MKIALNDIEVSVENVQKLTKELQVYTPHACLPVRILHSSVV